MADTLWNSVGQNASTISPLGGGKTWWAGMASDGSAYSPAATWYQGPYMKEVKFKDSTPFKKYPCDDGTVLVSSAEREVDMTYITYQRNIEVWKASITSANPLASGPQFFAVLQQFSKQKVNGVYEYALLQYVQLEAVLENAKMGNETTIHCWLNPIPTTIVSATFTGVTGAASSLFPVGASITVDTTVNPYYQWYTPLS